MKYIAILFAGMLAFAWHQTPARAADQGGAPTQVQQDDQNATQNNGQQMGGQQMDSQQQTDPEPAVDNGQEDDQSDEGHQIGDNGSDSTE